MIAPLTYALEQFIIPVRIEDFGKYSAANLPIWVKEIQLFNFSEESIDYQNRFKSLKQLLGDPFPIQKHLEDMLILYKTSGILLDEVALNLIEKHKNDISWPKGKKALAEELIEKSKRKLQDYWERYDKLEKDYENAKLDNSNLKKNFKIHLAVLVILYIALAVYAFVVIYNYFN